MSRFDYVKYDESSIECQSGFKDMCENLGESIEKLGPSRATSLALTKLEEVYMWIGKAIRDNQLLRNNETQLQEERGES